MYHSLRIGDILMTDSDKQSLTYPFYLAGLLTEVRLLVKAKGWTSAGST